MNVLVVLVRMLPTYRVVLEIEIEAEKGGTVQEKALEILGEGLQELVRTRHTSSHTYLVPVPGNSVLRSPRHRTVPADVVDKD
jgi:hypothetical protein